jgi:Na+/H+ antiporter NhaD/arsenite permease-like protein
MLFGLGSLWLTCDALHAGKADEEDLKASKALQRIDVESIIFFIGILLSIDALDSSGVLKALATWLNDNVHSSEVVAIVLGAASSVVDNVPLVRDNIVLSFPAPCILLNCSLKLECRLLQVAATMGMCV